MQKLLLSFLIIVLFNSCSEEEITPNQIEGEYSGIFYRTNPSGQLITSEVTLTLNDGTFTGDSDMEKYPAICTGSYKVNGNRIEFTDSCIWTADFDWTLILSGKYDATLNKNELILIRDYNEFIDLYRLQRIR